ncbi:MAG: PAS domain S-box protein [Desulfobacteraceae bacterium]|nr:PAS domain S-box protein [Desulfobacteraceae bacterium]
MENHNTFHTTEETHEKLILIMKALDSTSDAIGISDPKGRHFYQNKAFSDLFGFKTAGELQAGGGAFAVIQDKSTAREMLDSIMAGEPWAGELTMVTKSGRSLPAFQRADAIRDDSGEIIGLIGVITDWTERKRAESELSHSREFLDSVINGIADPLFVKDENHRWIALNDALCRMFGHSRTEMLGKSDYDFFPPEQADVFWAHDDMVMASDTVDVNEEEITGGGQTHTISTIKSSFINPTTGRRNLVGTIRDITERKRAENLLLAQHDLARALGGAVDLDDCLGHCVGFAIKGSAMDCGSIYLVQPDGSFSIRSHSGLSQSFVKATAWYPPDSPNAELVLKGEPVFTHYDKLEGAADPVRKQEGVKAVCLIPIKHEHRVIGCLSVGSHKTDTFPKISRDALKIITSLMGQYIIRKQAEERLRGSEARLSKRVRELNCLFGLSSLMETPGISVEEFFEQGIRLIPAGWQYPEITCARLVFQGREYETDNYRDTPWRLSRELVVSGSRVGSLDVCYLEERPRAHLGPFLEEEEELMEALVERLQRVIKGRQTREALGDSEEKYRNLYENAQIGLVRTRLSDGLFLEANQRLVEMFGYDSRDELIRRLSITDLYAEPEERSHMIAELKEKGEVRNYEARFRKRDGSIWWLRFSGRLYWDKGYFEGVAADITENKEAEAEKARLEKHYRQARKVEAIGRLAAGVAHDMNNLLTPILGFGEMLMADLGLDDRQRRYVDQIVKAGNRSRDLVRQLLAFGRKQTLEYKPLNLNDTIKDFQKLLRRTIREDIEIDIIPDSGIQTIKADRGQIEQVIMNLAVNAQDAMPEGGRLTLETAMADIDEASAAARPGTRAGRYVMLAVSDPGCGMDGEIREHIFEPFFSTKGEQGTGLGLATVYGIVKQHGGNIWVYSEPGRGTTFKIYLPVSEEAQVEKKAREASSVELGGSGTILLVEDNDQVRDFSRDVLTQQGYTVLVAEGGAEALTRLTAHGGPVHLLLTDVIMPGMNGKELFTKASQRQPGLKVLYMSGYTGNAIARHGILEEGVAFIQKPFTVHGLAARVQNILRA